MAGVIPKEDLAAYKRWHLNSFDHKEAATHTTAPKTQEMTETIESEVLGAMHLPTAEDIERINEEALSLGYQAGFDEG